MKTRRIDQKLLWNTAADDTGAAEAIFLGEHHTRTMLRGNARGAHATRSASNNEKIDVVIGHVTFRVRAFSSLLAYCLSPARKDYPPRCRHNSCSHQALWALRQWPFFRAVIGRKPADLSILVR